MGRPTVKTKINGVRFRLLFSNPEFYSIPIRDFQIESDPVANRTYFIVNDKILAVASFTGPRRLGRATRPRR